MTAICSRSSRGERGFGGGGCRTAAEGRGLGSGSIASWLWSAERVRGALEVLAERSAQPSLSWRGGYKASEMHVPAFGLLKGAALHAWGSVVAFLLRLRQARWERCNAEVVQAVFAY